ncbi:unnamed protein product, partial [Gulo gulo]
RPWAASFFLAGRAELDSRAGVPGGQAREEALSLAVLCTREKISNRGENAFHRCELCSSERTRG